MSIVFYLLGFIIFLEAFRRLHTAYRLSRVELDPSPKSLVPDSSPASYELDLLAKPRAELESLGFSFSHTERWNRWENGVECPILELVFSVPGKNLRAYLSAAVLPDAFKNYSLSFVTTDRHEQVFRSLDTAGYFHFFPRSTMKIVSLYGLTPAEHFAEHQKWAGEPAALSPTSPSAAEHVHFESESKLVKNWLAEHRAEANLREENSRLRITLRGALTASGRLLTEMHKNADARFRAEKSGRFENQPVPLEAEVAAYEQVAKVQNNQSMKRAAKILLFLLTAALFLVSFGLTFSFSSVFFLLSVLFLHELGHILAMRAFGYQDLKILFLPFLGAVAVGRRRNVPTVHRVVVALAGPLPGLVLGLICYGAAQHFELPERSALGELAWTLLGINFFNLLPIMPLDGGQVLHALFFSRFPLLEALFSIAGGVFLALLGYVTGEPVLGFVALLILVSTKEQVRRSRLLKSLRRKLAAASAESGAAADEHELARTVFGHLSESGCERFPFTRRFQLADYLLTNVRAPAASMAQTGILFAFYLLSLALPPAVFVALSWNAAEAGVEEIDMPNAPVRDDLFLDEEDRALPEGVRQA